MNIFTVQVKQPKRTPTVRKLEQIQAVQQQGYVWTNDLSRRQKAVRAALAKTVPNWVNGEHAPPLSGYMLFCAVTSGRAAQRLPLLTDAPPFADLPPTLSRVTVGATVTENGPLRLTLSGMGYPCAVQVFAAKPFYSITDVTNATQYALLLTLPGLTVAGTYVGAEYGRLGTAEDGDALAVKLVLVSGSGFRGPAQRAVCVVGGDG